MPSSLPPTAAHLAAPTLAEPASAEERGLFAALDPTRLPRHVAVIMDGNGRWAKRRSLASRINGHEAGVDAVRAATRTATALRLHALTLYAFSSENWSRPRHEIEALMALLDRFLVEELAELMENNIRLQAMGRLSELRASTRRKLDDAIARTSGNDGLRLTLALSYGGRQELADAARRLAEDVAAGRLAPAEVDEAALASRLYLPDLPDPDLLVRTSGELRISNFLLWQLAYTELVILDVLWPDFRRVHFLGALVEYQKRDRRFGGVRQEE
ncbi:MAG: isoprenyl transferase [Candidatus Sumerlaeia bacterium]|nr:isoprenyl transferase [Candidatus Sumerlaeia bacterium]